MARDAPAEGATCRVHGQPGSHLASVAAGTCGECADRLILAWPCWEVRVRRYMRRKGLPADVAEDLAAEVLLVAWRRLPDLPSAPDEALRWLLGVSRRVMSNHWRSERRSRALVTRLTEEGGLREPIIDQAASDRSDFVHAWRCLGASDQLILLRAGWHGMSVPELAAAFGCSTDAAAKRLTRARTRLREGLVP